MILPALPADEAARLCNLHQYCILDTGPEPEYDCLAELAAQVCGCNTGAIVFIDENRQWIKARKSMTVIQTPREHSFCAHTILQDEVFIVENALLDARFQNNPLVTGAYNIRFYAGAPIVSGEGKKLGSVCVVDDQPRTLSVEQGQMLQSIADQVARILQLRLQNQQLKTEAENLLSMERLTVQHALRHQEAERQALGNQLHENMAQVLAAVKLQLELAGEQPAASQPLLQKAQAQISCLLNEMRRVTYELIPIALHCVPVQTLAQNLMHRLLGDTPAILELECTGTPELSQQTALVLFRILEDAFEMVKHKTGVTHLSIRIQTGKTIEIVIKDNGRTTADQHAETQIFSNTIRNRVTMQHGTFDTSLDRAGMHTLLVSLPGAAA